MIPHLFHWVWIGASPLPEVDTLWMRSWLGHNTAWGGISLTLQIMKDGAQGFSNYASGIGASQGVAVSGLEGCTWYGLRWKTALAS